MYPNPSTPGDRRSKSALIAGCLALTVAVLAAYTHPPTGYELSIYAGTPIGFWVAVSVALLVAATVSLSAASRPMRGLALGLGASAMLAVVALPLLRGYYFYGAGDSMTHLGWARDIATGSLSATNLLYPSIHTATVFLTEVTGLSLRHALLLVVVVFVAAFFVFVPLTVRAIAGDSRAVTLAALAALLLVPINHLGVQIDAHPTSQAIMFLPVVLYLLVTYTTRRDRRPNPISSISPAGTLFAVALLGMLFVHPQQTANVILLLGVVSVVQYVYRRYRPDHPIGTHRTVYAHTLMLAVAFLLWAPRFPRSSEVIRGILSGLLSNPNTGKEIAQHGGSLTALGSSLGDLFLKLFLVSAVFALLAGLLGLGALLHRLDDRRASENAIVLYFTLGLVPVAGLFAVYFLGGAGTQYFRLLGFMMAVATVLGSLALHRGLGWFSSVVSARTVRVVAIAFFVVLLALSVPTVFRSGYIYQPSQQVTQAQVQGYQTAFQYRSPGVYYTGIRASGSRFGDMLHGTTESSSIWWKQYAHWNQRSAPNGFTARSLRASYTTDEYLVVTSTNRAAELRLYHGFRYPRRSFDALESSPHIDRVEDDAGVGVYLVHPSR